MANKYGEDVYNFIKKHVKNRTNVKLLELVNSRFGDIFTLKTLKSFKGNHKLSSGLTGRFIKGHTPSNKGQKMDPEKYKKCAGTMFKKGHIPHNHRTLGSERITKDGFIAIKIKEPNKWMLKQRYIWEQITGEKIPEGGIITFLDGDRRNFDISNLACITKNENCRLNHRGIRSDSADITKANINIVRLDNKIRELKRK